MQACRYRLANLHCSDSEVVSSVPSRHDVKRVERRRKTAEKKTPGARAGVEEVEAVDTNGALEDPWSEYDFDAEMEDGWWI